ncbi:type VI secretion system baseplate subunit TssK [Methylicorpusculum sp.]|uniref:type VI secretion system baseplate subunit TssK n=1 Tax=Methylicorpusculum sp. TaxID=2713644 RepID=UPI002731A9C6|nr:type VI secretion system baseplate subunit TssK [Methylicorpusculum sp.]MDP2178751.1 type VI secretion system baseplate subunit TssK [Methylicorpusculum sp.]MDP3527743.1 type VI secretion system baseplate subunit TssK [Methylicorpusculum sp.]MDZ4150690.1 type VI secretion system baseplate subunit TssK [Methylicorpusculum sp.]
MAENNRTVWSEGMFLRPQHFQQHDRYIETLIRERCGGFNPYDWGFKKIRIDPRQLAMGKFSLTECSGVFPDGTPFNLPEDDDLPLPVDISVDTQNTIIYLSLPTRQPGNVEVDTDQVRNKLARYHAVEYDVRDHNTGTNVTSPVSVGKLHTTLMLETQERAGHLCLGVARIIESRIDKNVILDEQFIPPSVDCNALPILKSFIKELSGLLHTRGEALGGRATEAGRGGVTEIADFMLLQTVNRVEPLFEHLQNIPAFHPESFYRLAVQLAGELSTFCKPNKRPVSFPPYQHDDLQLTFARVMSELRDLLSSVLEQNAIPIPLTPPKYGIRGAKVPDPHLLKDAVFVLAVNAQITKEQLRSGFPTQVKIGPVEQIQQLVRSALPGITIHPLPVAPRQIPYHAGFAYFELNKQGELWKQMYQSGGFAIHIAGDFPGLELEFWAIKNG